MSTWTTHVGTEDEDLEDRLGDELDKFNAAATPDVPAEQDLTVRVRDRKKKLLGGASGWTWGTAAAIDLAWVRDDQRGQGVGRDMLTAFENEARRRGCTHIFVSTYSFQAPGFYQRLGYQEICRWTSVPTSGRDDIYLRKDL